jgi:hypothetical protein
MIGIDAGRVITMVQDELAFLKRPTVVHLPRETVSDDPAWSSCTTVNEPVVADLSNSLPLPTLVGLARCYVLPEAFFWRFGPWPVPSWVVCHTMQYSRLYIIRPNKSRSHTPGRFR